MAYRKCPQKAITMAPISRADCTLYLFVSPHFLIDQVAPPDREKL